MCYSFDECHDADDDVDGDDNDDDDDNNDDDDDNDNNDDDDNGNIDDNDDNDDWEIKMGDSDEGYEDCFPWLFIAELLGLGRKQAKKWRNMIFQPPSPYHLCSKMYSICCRCYCKVNKNNY